MNYWKLKRNLSEAELKRTIPRLKALRDRLAVAIPPKDAEDNLLLASWNIRDLGDPKGAFGHGERLPESFFYIAEVLSRFDFVAIQEVNNLPPWEKIMDILGPQWGFIASDVTEGASGNDERLTYLFDTRKISFRNIAGEIVLQPSGLIEKDAKGGKQFARSPYFASFQAGWRKFDICTVHIYYGEDHGPGLKRRTEEIAEIADLLGKRADLANEKGKALVLLGDFNVVGLEHETMKALLSKGFTVPPAIQEPPEGQRNNYYDQIAFKTAPDAIVFPEGAKEEAGSLRIYENVFTLDQIDDYREHFEADREKSNEEKRKKAEAKGKEPKLTTPEEAFEHWRTWELSDHQPLWVRLKANDSDNYLKRLLEMP